MNAIHVGYVIPSVIYQKIEVKYPIEEWTPVNTPVIPTEPSAPINSPINEVE